MTNIALSNSLIDLAYRINAEHEAVQAALKDGLQRAVACGRLLIEAKEQLRQHGSWLPWLKDNTDVSVRTAQAYMQVARGFGELKADPDKSATGVAHLSLRRALDFLAEEAFPRGIRHERVTQRRASFSFEVPKALLPSDVSQRKMRVAHHKEKRQLMLVIGPEITVAEMAERKKAARESPSVKAIEQDREDLVARAEALEEQAQKLREEVKVADAAIREEIDRLSGSLKPYSETYEFQCSKHMWDCIQKLTKQQVIEMLLATTGDEDGLRESSTARSATISATSSSLTSRSA